VARKRPRQGAGRPRAQNNGRSKGASSELARALELAALVESASDAVFGVAPGGVIASWSEGARLLFGYSQAEAVGRQVEMLVPAERSDEARAIGECMHLGERIERMETERVTKDGRLLNVLLSVSPVWGHDGQFEGSVAILHDLSAQRNAEAELRASEQRYHSIVEALSEGVVMQDRDGRILALNKSVERILGLPQDQPAKGTALHLSIPLIREDGSPFLGDELPTMVSVRTGEPQYGVVVGVEGTDGSTRWISVNSRALIRPGQSEPYAAVASFSDITELRDTLEELNEARFEDLKRLAIVSEYRDDDTSRHTGRVTRTAELLAVELGLDRELITTLHHAAPLHDVGKIGIPDSILLKPGKLTIEEFEVIKTHTVIGGRILGQSHFPVVRMAMEIAFTHHERWDGTGYPARLQGEAIPITGRIVAVADAFDAMTHARPYKDALPVQTAVAEIERCSGTQFDPRVVDAFMTLDHHTLVDTD